ncbi:hypothetical protein GCM10012278_68350 [Nonomuraea glycinis]|uniref:Uncharacterized protein n=1 Tax=Nonomuraea glycinis TaxID=2047744 RepID=A0A918AC22_9ACTN|nr:hypothetical protein GCM10012278_68350 [Nonomuraea glycinis]
MCHDSRQHAAALAWYDRSHAWAIEAGDSRLAATTLNMRAHQAWILGDPHRCVRIARLRVSGAVVLRGFPVTLDRCGVGA